MIFDIDEKLNEIIFKYRLDKSYPQYRDSLRAGELIRKLFENFGGGGRSAFLSGIAPTKCPGESTVSSDA